MGGRTASGAHRHSGADPRNSHRARRVALACEVVSEDHITRSKTARRAIADPDFHLPREGTVKLAESKPDGAVSGSETMTRSSGQPAIGIIVRRATEAMV
jgi:hypothetical protein